MADYILYSLTIRICAPRTYYLCIAYVEFYVTSAATSIHRTCTRNGSAWCAAGDVVALSRPVTALGGILLVVLLIIAGLVLLVLGLQAAGLGG